jgi:hypothetical protein
MGFFLSLGVSGARGLSVFPAAKGVLGGTVELPLATFIGTPSPPPLFLEKAFGE